MPAAKSTSSKSKVPEPVTVAPLSANGHHANGKANGHHANGHTDKPVSKVTKVAKPVKPVETVPEPVLTTPQEAATVAPATTTATTQEVPSAAPAEPKAKSRSKKAAKSKSAKAKPAKPAKTASKKAGKRVSKKATKTAGRGSRAKKQEETKEESKKRVHNVDPTTIESVGIGIGQARVKNILRHVALNPREFAVTEALENAHRPAPTIVDEKEVPNPQVHLKDLPADVQEMVREAEVAYELSLREAYEDQYVDAMQQSNPERYKKYVAARKEAKQLFEKKCQEENKNKYLKAFTSSAFVAPKFDLHAFNLEFDSHFYDGYQKFREEKDNYKIGSVRTNNTNTKNNKPHTPEPYNEWTRAKTLVNKLSVRLSGRTHYIIACFLDRIVEQFARNGIANCLVDGKRTVSLTHTLQRGENYFNTCYMHNFVSTLPHYRQAQVWLDTCNQLKQHYKELRKNSEEEVARPDMPNYPQPYDKKYNFKNYVNDICRSVRKQLAADETNEEKKALYIGTNVSDEFKMFCSYVLYETILRIGESLKNLIRQSGVKTISDEMVCQSLEQLHIMCGIDFTLTQVVMSEHLKKYGDNPKKDRAAKRGQTAKSAQAE